jgi:paraquat-inducible protein B
MIGSFVVGAITLVIVVVALLGAGKLFRKTYPFILYFERDVSGLRVGAPVKFKGVEIGSVINVLLNVGDFAQEGPLTEKVRIPVLIELDEARIRQKGAKISLKDPEVRKLMIEGGLRGQLTMESFLTGLLYVKLDMLPGTPAKFVADPSVEYPEIPTIPTPLEEAQAVASKFLQKLDQVDFAGLMRSISNVAEGLDKLVNSPELSKTVHAINRAIENLNLTITSFRNTANELNTNIAPVSKSLKAAIDDADAAIKEAKVTIAAIGNALQPDSQFMYQINTSLEVLSATARTVRSLADFLERNPTSLLRGKAEPEGKR